MFYKENLKKRYFWIIVAVAAVSLVMCLGMGLFNTKGEPREAVVALTMLKSGDWVAPVNNGVDIAYKPPFFHWCVALCSLLQGHVSEFTARLPSALACILMVLVGYCAMLRSRVDERLALLTALVTLSAFEVHRGAMACRVDMMLSAMVAVAILVLHRWTVERRWWLALLAVLAMSCAALTKGPVGILLPCGVVGVYMLLRGERLLTAVGRMAAVGLAACVLPAVWYVMAYREHGDAFLYLVFEENFLRFTGKMVYSSHEEPWFYNVLTLLSGFLPYTLLAVLAFAGVRWRAVRLPRRGTLSGWLAGKWRALRRLPDHDLLSVVSVVIIFVFYCIPKSKRSVYLLPLYPFLAYYVARLLLYMAGSRKRLFSAYTAVMAVLMVAVPLLLVLLKTEEVEHFAWNHAGKSFAYVASLSAVPLAMVLSALAAAVGVAVWLRRMRRGGAGAFGMSVMASAVALLTYLWLDAMVLPAVYAMKSDRAVADEIGRLVPRGVIWDYRSDFHPGERNRMHQFTVNFYLGDRVVPLDLNRPARGFMIMGDDDVDAFHASHPEYALQRLRRFSHKSCDDKRRLSVYYFKIEKLKK